MLFSTQLQLCSLQLSCSAAVDNKGNLFSNEVTICFVWLLLHDSSLLAVFIELKLILYIYTVHSVAAFKCLVYRSQLSA